MTQSETKEDGCDGESGDEEQSEEGDDEVEVVKGSGSRTVSHPFCVCPRGTRRTLVGHTLMTPSLPVRRTN
jgi:hypothetical protein